MLASATRQGAFGPSSSGPGGATGPSIPSVFNDEINGINGQMDGLFGAISVPAPIAGAGPPGLIVACGATALFGSARGRVSLGPNYRPHPPAGACPIAQRSSDESLTLQAA
jgi:hypothetical protein